MGAKNSLLDRFDGIDLLDRFDGIDPQIPQRLFVSFCDETHGHFESSHEVELAEPDQSELMDAMGSVFFDVLTRQERYVLVQRLYMRNTYETIANTSWPRLSGPSQARKIEQRALRKMRERLARFRKDLKPKRDTSDMDT